MVHILREQLYLVFCNFVQDQRAYGKLSSEGWKKIKNVIKSVPEKEGKKEDRIKEWEKAIYETFNAMGSRKNKLTIMAFRFRLDLVDPIDQNHSNSRSISRIL